MDAAQPGRSTASRLFALLEAFHADRPVLNLTGLAHAADLPIPTTLRIARELVRLGALERNEDGTYQIGVRLWEIGSAAPRQRDLREVARPVMEGLHEATGETIQVAVLEDFQALCVEKVSGSRSAANVTEVARGLPLHATGVGKVILAFGEPGLLSQLVARGLPRCTSRTVVMPGLLRQALQRIRTERLAYSREEMTLGTASIAAPIFDERQHFVAAIGILTKSSTDLSRLASAVTTASVNITRRLGTRAQDRTPRRYTGAGPGQSTTDPAPR